MDLWGSDSSHDYSIFTNCPIETLYLGRNRYHQPFYLFRNHKHLKDVVIGNSVTTIEVYFFYCCPSLTNVTFGNSVTTIEERAFENCTSLATISIPNSVTEIPYNTFYKCTSLTSVTIGNSVESIGAYAFSGCKELKSIISLAATPPVICESTFDARSYLNCTLYVPIGCLDSYRSAAYWNYFMIEEIDVTGISAIKNDKQDGKNVYDLQGRKLDTLQKGINIINGKKVLVR